MPHDDTCDPDEGEMDIMEMVNGNGDYEATYHWETHAPQPLPPTPAQPLPGCMPWPSRCGCQSSHQRAVCRTFPGANCSYPNGHGHAFAHSALPTWNTSYHEYAVERGRHHVAFVLDGKVQVRSHA